MPVCFPASDARAYPLHERPLSAPPAPTSFRDAIAGTTCSNEELVRERVRTGSPKQLQPDFSTESGRQYIPTTSN